MQPRDAGLMLVEETLVQHDGHWYPTLAWAPGTPETDWSELDLRFGPLLRARADPQLRRFLGAELTRVAQVLARAQRNGASASSLGALQDELSAVEHELARLAIVPALSACQPRSRPRSWPDDHVFSNIRRRLKDLESSVDMQPLRSFHAQSSFAAALTTLPLLRPSVTRPTSGELAC